MKPKILVVDDAPDSWHLLSTILRNHQFDPLWAADGMQAMAEAREHKPQAILLDLGLPDGDGFVVLERVKGNRMLADIPVIIVTVRDPDVAEAKAKEHGAAAFFQKPVKAEELIATIRGLLERPA